MRRKNSIPVKAKSEVKKKIDLTNPEDESQHWTATQPNIGLESTKEIGRGEKVLSGKAARKKKPSVTHLTKRLKV